MVVPNVVALVDPPNERSAVRAHIGARFLSKPLLWVLTVLASLVGSICSLFGASRGRTPGSRRLKAAVLPQLGVRSLAQQPPPLPRHRNPAPAKGDQKRRPRCKPHSAGGLWEGPSCRPVSRVHAAAQDMQQHLTAFAERVSERTVLSLEMYRSTGRLGARLSGRPWNFRRRSPTVGTAVSVRLYCAGLVASEDNPLWPPLSDKLILVNTFGRSVN